MAGQNNGGNNQNPWGSGPRGGGSGGSGGGGEPPNIDEFIRKGQDKLKGAMPGGMGGKTGFTLGLVAFVILWLTTGIYQVENNERGVVLRFGKVVTELLPGLHIRFPYPIESVLTPAVTREHTIEVGRSSTQSGGSRRSNISDSGHPEGQMLTGDENIVNVAYTIVWDIKNANNYLFKLEDQEETVKAVARSVLREVVGRSTFQEVITDGRDVIQSVALQLTQKVLDEYESGINIKRFQIEGASPPTNEVVDAFTDVQRAQADREQKIATADGYRNEKIPQAEGEAERLTQGALAYQARIVNGAKGEAARFTAVYKEYLKAKDITKRRIYLETMEEILSGMDKVILDDDGTGVVPYLPINELGKKNKKEGN